MTMTGTQSVIMDGDSQMLGLSANNYTTHILDVSFINVGWLVLKFIPL